MNLNKDSIATVDVSGKRVLMRVDFNVPQDKSGAITNNQVCHSPTAGVALAAGVPLPSARAASLRASNPSVAHCRRDPDH